MVRIPNPPRPASAAPRLNQEFEGHGLYAPAPFDRGYRHVADRPVTAEQHTRRPPPGMVSAQSSGAAKRAAKAAAAAVPKFAIHAHVREKVITIQAGAGNQCIYWLGASAVTRFLSQPFSYSSPYSQELTAKAVIAANGEHLERTARICNELQDGDHVWIDVGDGVPLSHVRSRSFPDRHLLEPGADAEYQEHIGWEPSPADMLDDEVIGVDPRQSMRYVRTVLAKQPSIDEWQAQQQPATAGSGEEAAAAKEESQRELFNATWGKIHVEDMDNASMWMGDFKFVVKKNFDLLRYIFVCQSSEPADAAAERDMSFLEFWALCKRCALISPWLNLAKINREKLLKVSGEQKVVAGGRHDPNRKLQFADFLSALVRVSVHRQKNPKDTDPASPSACCAELIEFNLQVLTPGLDTFVPSRAAPAPFASPSVRQKLVIHEPKLKALFRKWAVEDDTHETIKLGEFLDMFAASGTMGADLTDEMLTRDFVVAMLGDHEGSFDKWAEAGDKACQDLIFSEFVEAVMRAALSKYEGDADTAVDLKVHELCLLLVFGPAAKQPARFR